MAVYTEVTFDEAAALVDSVGLGALQALAPCKGGIENTNYFADTAAGRYVLTVFERLRADELPFYLQLMKHHADHALPVPRPHADASGSLVLALAGKPAAIVDRLPGEHHLAPDAEDCANVGAMLARLHASARDFAPAQPNLRGLAWWSETVPVVVPHLSSEQAALMQDELAYQRHLAASSAYANLPRAAIHGDLFRDNVMFVERSLAGVFDFYFAGVDTLLFDIAVALNDWCIDLASGRLDEDRADRLRRRLRVAAPARDRRGPADAGPDAGSGVPLLAVARLGPAPAARRRRSSPRTTPTTSSASSCSGARRPGILPDPARRPS